MNILLKLQQIFIVLKPITNLVGDKFYKPLPHPYLHRVPNRLCRVIETRVSSNFSQPEPWPS